MKRSSTIILGAVLLAAISSCSNQPKEKDEWITGADHNGKTRDTLINNQQYRHYGMGWFLIINGVINPGRYQPSTLSQIRTPGHVPAHIRTGGFGASGRSSSVSS
ncbi:MAG TPA: hypothetical protein VF373_12165 [Prolixibacteraceae bacterium]